MSTPPPLAERDRACASQRGISLIEALVMLAVTSLAVALALPVLGRGSASDFRLAGTSLSRSASDRGEEAFRVLLRSAAPAPDAPASLAEGRLPLAVGDRNAIEFTAFLETSTLCTRDIGWVHVRFWIETDTIGGVLRCASAGRADVLTRWTGEASGFTFKHEDSGWRPDVGALSKPTRAERVARGGDARQDAQTSTTRPSLTVRFSAPAGAGRERVWMEVAPAAPAPSRAEPVRVDDGGGDLDR